MTDTRFGTLFDDVDDLLGVLEVDEVDDIETLLMFLLRSPIAVVRVWGEDGSDLGLEVFIRGCGEGIGYVHEFPLSIVDLARRCAAMGAAGGPCPPDSEVTQWMRDVSAMSDVDFVSALRYALGQVHVFNALDRES